MDIGCENVGVLLELEETFVKSFQEKTNGR